MSNLLNRHARRGGPASIGARVAAKLTGQSASDETDDETMTDGSEEEDASGDQTEEDASADDDEESAEGGEPAEGDDDEDESGPQAAVNAETNRVLAIVGSPEGLANPAMAVELASADEDGHRMSATRAIKLLKSSGPKTGGGRLDAKLRGQTAGLGPDGESGGQPQSSADKRAAAREAMKARVSADSRK